MNRKFLNCIIVAKKIIKQWNIEENEKGEEKVNTDKQKMLESEPEEKQSKS